MPSLGEILAKEREEKGLSIEEVSKIIKIQPKFIQALEQEDFESFSADIYLRGFLRTYAQYLGLEPEKLLSAYKETWARSELGRKNFHLGRKYLFDVHRPSMRYLIPGLFIIVIALAALSYYYQDNIWMQKGNYPPQDREDAKKAETKGNVKSKKEKGNVLLSPPNGTQEPILTQGKKPTPPPEPPIQQQPETFEQSAETSIQHPEVYIPEEQDDIEQVAKIATEETIQTSHSPLVLTIDALEDTWLKVSIDGTTQDELLLRSGESKEWKAEEKFVLLIGHVAGTRLRLNSKEISLPTTSTDVLRNFVLTREDVQP
jgi:cytoskeleton protein RodZ